MLTWLRRTFIKDYSDINNPKVRGAHGVLSAWVGIFINLILFGLKFASSLYLASKQAWVFSMALLGDSLNNLFDFSSSIITLVGFSLAKKPADEKHPFGHERAEYIAGMFIGVAIIVSTVLLLYRSIQGIIQAEQVSYDVFAFVVLGVTIPLKCIQSYVNLSLGKLLHSNTLRSVGMDSAIDIIVSSLLFLFAALSTAFSWPSMDSYLGCGLSLFLGYNGFNAIKGATDRLLGSPMEEGFVEKVTAICFAHKEIHGVHDVLCHAYGEDVRYVSLHVELDGSLTLFQAHEVIDKIEKEIGEALHAEAIVHPDPIDSQDSLLAAYHEKIAIMLQGIDPSISFHDLRWKNEEEKKALSCDILLPFHHEKTLEEKIQACLRDIDLPVEITFDHPF